MIEIAFIILNYNNFVDTQKCIDSIRKKVDTENYRIIVVDNCSKKIVQDEVSSYCINSTDVTLIELDENLGFARGNNAGIREARELGARFICCINDDAMLLSNDITKILECKLAQFNPAVIGPEIIRPNGRSQELSYFKSIEEYKRGLELLESKGSEHLGRESVKMWLRKHPMIGKFVYRLYYAIRHKEKGSIDNDIDRMDLLLQGCCLFFTPVFFEKLNGFNEATFLFAEEDFLYADLSINHLRTLYTTAVKVYHKGGVSTSKSRTTSKQIADFRNANRIESLKKLINYLTENKEAIYHGQNGEKVD